MRQIHWFKQRIGLEIFFFFFEIGLSPKKALKHGKNYYTHSSWKSEAKD
jgi:hypothetical protein